MRRAVAFGNFEKVLLPNFLSGLRLQAMQYAGGAQGVDALTVNDWRGPRPGSRAWHAAPGKGRVRGVVTIIAITPALLPGRRLQADYYLLVLFLGLSEEPAIGHDDRGEGAR